VVTRKKKSENVVKLEVKSADSLRDIIEFNSKILTEILHKLEVLNKKLNKAILLEKKLKNLQEEVVKALQANQQLVSTQPIMVNGQEVQPTIGNWLADFKANNLIDASNAVKIQYFNNSKNFRSLSESDKNLIDATAMRLQIIGESIKKIPNKFKKNR